MTLDLYIWDRWHCKSRSIGRADIGWAQIGHGSMATTYWTRRWNHTHLPCYLFTTLIMFEDEREASVLTQMSRP